MQSELLEKLAVPMYPVEKKLNPSETVQYHMFILFYMFIRFWGLEPWKMLLIQDRDSKVIMLWLYCSWKMQQIYEHVPQIRDRIKDIGLR